MGQPLGTVTARIGRRAERRQHVIVEEVGERPVPDVVEQTGDAQRLDHESLGRDRLLAGRHERCAQAWIEGTGPQAGLVHDPEAVREARMLGGREDPARALKLADAAQALQPRGVEEVLLGDVLGRQPGYGRRVGRQPLAELEVPVDRVADEVDGRKRVTARGSRYGSDTRVSALHTPTLPARSRPRTLSP